MRAITLHPAAAEALAPLAFGAFTPTVWPDGGYLALWLHTAPWCSCQITISPDNLVNDADAPAEFTPAGPWSFSGCFDVATSEGCANPGHWGNPLTDSGHPTPHHAWAAAHDEHRAKCFEFRDCLVQCLSCGDLRGQHGPGGSPFACEDFTPGTELGRADWEHERRRRGLYVPDPR
ncbi:hypothetical protein [Streptomyces sp. NRRL B-24484]|uniref:hypothetical protein n=1 Tax=Streptomyces sp. NRRL B-24484 TaxID=1463833 RepID=UPI0004C0C18F|nr:hypothetical protein [Streptomyces sp. NRRL B-24484]